MINDLCGVASRSAFIKYCLKELLKKKSDTENTIKTIAEYEKYRLINENCALYDMDIIDEAKMDKTIYNLTIEVQNMYGDEIIDKIKTINVELIRLYDDNYDLKIKSINNFKNDIISHDELIKNKSISLKNAMDLICAKQKILANKFTEYAKNAHEYEQKNIELTKKEKDIQKREIRYNKKELIITEKEKLIDIKEFDINQKEQAIIEKTKNLKKLEENIANQSIKLNDIFKQLTKTKKELSDIENEIDKNNTIKRKQEDIIKHNKDYINKLTDHINENTKILDIQKLNLEQLYNSYPNIED
jgi:hypothetical protein